MQPLGIVDSLIETMILPVRRWRVALPLCIASSIALLACAFGFDDSAAFGYPIDYTAIGLRLPHIVFGSHGWPGIAVWLASYFMFTSTLAVWTLAISQGAAFRPEPAMLLKRCLQFFAANLLVPVTFIPLIATVYLSNLEDLVRDEPDNWYALPFGLSDDVFPIVAILGPPLAWLCLRLALWPSMILFTGWHGALRRAWVAGRGFMLRLLCHVVVMAIATVKIFDVLSFLSYRLQFALLEYTAFDTAVLVTISAVGIVCTILLGLWTSALMVLHIPGDFLIEEQPARSIF